MSKAAYSTLVTVLFSFLIPHSWAGDRKINETSGEKLYHDYCSVCHGDKGDGKSRAQNSFIRPPRDFTASESKHIPREYMVNIVRDGKAGTAMVGWKTQLNEQQISAVVDYIRTKFTGLPQTGAGSSGTRTADKVADMSLPTPNKLKGNAQKGANIYYANCATCHGTKGDGQGPRAYFINPKPRNFLLPTSKTAFNRPAIYEAIANGRLGTEMPAWNKVLTEQEIADTTEFVFKNFIQPQAKQANP